MFLKINLIDKKYVIIFNVAIVTLNICLSNGDLHSCLRNQV